MPVFAIVNQTNPVGRIRPEEFRAGADGPAALAAFVAEHTPPLPVADYLALDVGAAVPDPGPDRSWRYDFGTGTLVDVPNRKRASRFLFLRSPDGTVWRVAVTNAGALNITAT